MAEEANVRAGGGTAMFLGTSELFFDECGGQGRSWTAASLFRLAL